MDPIVIVGASHAGVELAFALRRLGYDGPVLLLDEGADLPYQRPPLSKSMLLEAAAEGGSGPRAEAIATPLRPAAAYAKSNIEFVGGARVRRIDTAGRRIELDGRAPLRYAKLALATGGRARRLPHLDERPAPNAFYLRSLADARGLRAGWRAGARVVIIGGGYIGLEVAAAATKRGLHATIVESQPRVLARVTSPEMSAFLERVHADAGVRLVTGARFDRFEYAGSGEIARVLCTDFAGGNAIALDADLVVVGIGMVPSTELAADAGLAVDDGIVVDEYAAASAPDVVAAGDCTRHPNALLATRLRLESVQNAVEQARAAAATLCGNPQPYRTVPWFWSDQYDLKLQSVGLAHGYDRIVRRGDLETRSFCVFYLRDGRLVAADMVNRPREFVTTRRLLAERCAVTPQQLADESFELAALLQAPLLTPG